MTRAAAAVVVVLAIACVIRVSSANDVTPRHGGALAHRMHRSRSGAATALPPTAPPSFHRGAAGPPPLGAAGPPPLGAAGPPPLGAAGPPPLDVTGARAPVIIHDPDVAPAEEMREPSAMPPDAPPLDDMGEDGPRE